MSQAVSSLPRPLLLAVVGAAAVLALMFATRRGSETSPATPAPSQSQASSNAGTDAKPSNGSQKGSGGANPAARTASDSKHALPAPVKRALGEHKVVVLLFWNPNGSDDRSVKEAVDSTSRHGGAVTKFTDTLGNLSRYTKVTASQGVTQTPTVVVVDRQGKGRFATGLQDSATVEQLVVDALK